MDANIDCWMSPRNLEPGEIYCEDNRFPSSQGLVINSSDIVALSQSLQRASPVRVQDKAVLLAAKNCSSGEENGIVTIPLIQKGSTIISHALGNEGTFQKSFPKNSNSICQAYGGKQSAKRRPSPKKATVESNSNLSPNYFRGNNHQGQNSLNRGQLNLEPTILVEPSPETKPNWASVLRNQPKPHNCSLKFFDPTSGKSPVGLDVDMPDEDLIAVVERLKNALVVFFVGINRNYFTMHYHLFRA